MPLRSRGCSTNQPVTCGAPSGVGSVGLIDRTTICSIEKSEMIENLSPNAIGWLADVGLRQSRVADHGRPDVRYSRDDGRGACQAKVFRFPTLPPRDRGLSQRTEYQADWVPRGIKIINNRGIHRQKENIYILGCRRRADDHLMPEWKISSGSAESASAKNHRPIGPRNPQKPRLIATFRICSASNL